MMKKVLKTILCISMIMSLLIIDFLGPIPVYAATKEPQTLGDLKKQLADLKQQKKDNEADKKETQAEINAKNEAIRNADNEIDEAEYQIEQAEDKIEESNTKITEVQAGIEELLRFLQQLKSKNTYLEYVSESSSMTELIMRIKAVEQLNDYSQKKLAELEQLIKDNEKLKEELNKKQKELASKIESYKKTIASLNINMEEYDEFALDIDTQIKTVQANVDSYVKLCASSKKSYLGDNELLSDCADVPYNAGWLKPLKSGKVTSPEGYRTHPVTGEKYKFHSGIDIGGNPEGTPVYAAAAGVVSGIVTRYSCGGNMVYVNVTVGGKKYTTFYYHLLTINVKNGQVVTQNTIIGTVGGGSTAKKNGGYDTCTTGAHLHFGVETGYYSYSVQSKVIVPPGFNNVKGYTFKSRNDYYA